jgi:hypothetical protein
MRNTTPEEAYLNDKEDDMCSNIMELKEIELA